MRRALATAIWFSGAAFVAAALFLKIMGGGSDGFIGLGFPAGLSAFIPALLLGGPLGDKKKVKSNWAAAGRGALIVLFSHVLLPVTFLIFGSLGSTLSQPNLEVFFVGAIGIIFAGWVTFPVGIAAAIGLHRLRSRVRLPKGCAVHKYRVAGYIPISSSIEDRGTTISVKQKTGCRLRNAPDAH